MMPELLSIYQPAADAYERLPRAPPSAFSSRIVLPSFTSDLTVIDDRRPQMVRDEFNQSTGTRAIQHHWRVHTVARDITNPTYDDARERSYVLDVVHGYLVNELGRILARAADKTYAPSEIPTRPVAPIRRKRPEYERPRRITHRWSTHSGASRAVLVDVLQDGATALARTLWEEFRPRYEEYGHITPAAYQDPRVRWEWCRMQPIWRTSNGDDDLLTLDDLIDD